MSRDNRATHGGSLDVLKKSHLALSRIRVLTRTCERREYCPQSSVGVFMQTRLKTLGEPKHARRDHGPRLSALPMPRPLVRGTVAGLGVTPLRAVLREVRITRAFRTRAGTKRETRFSGRNFTIMRRSGLRVGLLVIRRATENWIQVYFEDERDFGLSHETWPQTASRCR